MTKELVAQIFGILATVISFFILSIVCIVRNITFSYMKEGSRSNRSDAIILAAVMQENEKTEKEDG